MYCILVTGVPASGKSTLAHCLGDRLNLPVFSKDEFKELLFDTIGFHSRAEKVRLGTAAMELMYDSAGRLLRRNQPCILENNFEHASKAGLDALLRQYNCTAITVRLTCDPDVLYRRFMTRNASPDRHLGHVVNDCYPQPGQKRPEPPPPPSFEQFITSVHQRGMDRFSGNGPCIEVDTTDFTALDVGAIACQLTAIIHTL